MSLREGICSLWCLRTLKWVLSRALLCPLVTTMVEAAEEAARKNFCGLHLRPLDDGLSSLRGRSSHLVQELNLSLNLKDNLVPCYEGLKSEKNFEYIPTKKEKRTPKVHVKNWVVQKGQLGPLGEVFVRIFWTTELGQLAKRSDVFSVDFQIVSTNKSKRLAKTNSGMNFPIFCWLFCFFGTEKNPIGGSVFKRSCEMNFGVCGAPTGLGGCSHRSWKRVV